MGTIGGHADDWDRMYPTPESTMEDAARHAESVQRRRLQALDDFAPRAMQILQAHGISCGPVLKDVLLRCRALRDASDEESLALLALLKTELERSLNEQGLRSAAMAWQAIESADAGQP